MPISVDSQLMKNQKAAILLPARSSFQTLQTQGGKALLFCLSDEGNLDMIVETNGSQTGWTTSDLSLDLKNDEDENNVIKKISVSQRDEDGLISIAIVTQNESKAFHAYVLLHMPNADGSEWMVSKNARKWIDLPLSFIEESEAANIHSILLSESPGEEGQEGDTRCIALVVQMQNKDEVKGWCVLIKQDGIVSNVRFDNAPNFISQVLSLTHNGQLILYQLAPQSDDGRPALYHEVLLDKNLEPPSSPIKGMNQLILCPEEASQLSIYRNKKGKNKLLVAANKAIWHLNPQKSKASFHKIISNKIISKVRQLYSYQSSTGTFVWGLNQQGSVFYSKCDKNRIKNPKSWSHPIPLLKRVTHLSPSPINHSKVIFVHTEDNLVQQLVRNATTTH